MRTLMSCAATQIHIAMTGSQAGPHTGGVLQLDGTAGPSFDATMCPSAMLDHNSPKAACLLRMLVLMWHSNWQQSLWYVAVTLAGALAGRLRLGTAFSGWRTPPQ